MKIPTYQLTPEQRVRVIELLNAQPAANAHVMARCIVGLTDELAEARAQIAKLRAFAHSLVNNWAARPSMWDHDLLDASGTPTALLTGEGRGEG